MSETIKISGLYKIRNKNLTGVEEILSKYVWVQEFATNPLVKDEVYVAFLYVFKDTLEPTSHIHPAKILPYKTFLEYFELDMNTHEVNEKLYELEKYKNN